MSNGLRPLTPLNENYDPPRPWRCMTLADHECTSVVIGAFGSYPVCGPGAVAERAEREADRQRIALLMEDPVFQARIAEEIETERRIERGR